MPFYDPAYRAVTLGGNTAGTSTFLAGVNQSLFLNGGNNITLSGNGNSITISGAAAGGAQTAISGIGVSDTTYTSGTVIFSNQANVTLGSSVNGASQYVRISVAAQSNQSAIKGFGASNTGNTAGNTGISTGVDWVIAGTNNVTISESTAGGGPNTLWISGANTAAQTTQSAIKAFGVSNTGNTAGNTGVSTGIDWVLAASNSLTLSQSTAAGGPDTVWVQVGAYLTTADLSANSSKYVQNWKLTGNTAGTTSSAQGTDLWFSGGNSITVSGNSNTVVFSVGNYITTADLSQNSSKYVQNWKLTGNTAGTTSSAQGTDLWFSGGNSITVSGNSNTVVFSVGNYITTADLSQNSSKYVQNWKLTGNTAGTTSSAQGTDLWFSGGNNVTVSGSSNTIVVSTPNMFAAGVSTGGNTSGSTGTVSSQIVFVGSQGITLRQSTGGASSATITISGDGVTLSSWEAYQGAAGLAGVIGNATTAGNIWVQPFALPQWLSVGAVQIPVSVFFLTVGTSSGMETGGMQFALFSRNGSTLSSITSTTFSWGVTGNNSTYSISQVTQTNFTGYGAMSQTTSAGVNITSQYTGLKAIQFPMNTLLSPGQYWFGVVHTQSTSSNNVGMTLALAMGVLYGFGDSANLFAPMGSLTSAYTTGLGFDGGGNWYKGLGRVTSGNANIPASINFSDIQASVASGLMLPLYLFST